MNWLIANCGRKKKANQLATAAVAAASAVSKSRADWRSDWRDTLTASAPSLLLLLSSPLTLVVVTLWQTATAAAAVSGQPLQQLLPPCLQLADDSEEVAGAGGCC